MAGRQKGRGATLPEIAIEAIEEASGLSRATVVARLNRTGSAAQHQDVLFPAPLLARLAKVSIADDLPLLRKMMARFGEHGAIEAHYVVEATCTFRASRRPTSSATGSNRYPPLRSHIGVGLARRDGFPRDRSGSARLARGDARTQIMVKMVQGAADARTCCHGTSSTAAPRTSSPPRRWLLSIGPPALDEPLRNLLTFHDARYYPNDALLRHAAMASLVRALALIASRPVPATPRPAPAESAPRSP